jgi:DNA-directed RNA polymerase specialized sigma24 family protein
MKETSFTFVLIADQVSSRTGADAVPDALARLAGLDCLLPFERTAGDEVQALLAAPDAVVEAVVRLTRLSGWRIGLGAGTVDAPLPSSTREARGLAYLAAREAITAARRRPTDLALRLPADVSGDGYGDLLEAATDAETAIWLLRGTLARRSREGWELMDLLDAGLTSAEAAERLGISRSAVSQRLAASAREEGTRGARLAARLLRRVQGGQPSELGGRP